MGLDKFLCLAVDEGKVQGSKVKGKFIAFMAGAAPKNTPPSAKVRGNANLCHFFYHAIPSTAIIKTWAFLSGSRGLERQQGTGEG